jgi:hypothetical protein
MSEICKMYGFFLQTKGKDTVSHRHFKSVFELYRFCEKKKGTITLDYLSTHNHIE